MKWQFIYLSTSVYAYLSVDTKCNLSFYQSINRQDISINNPSISIYTHTVFHLIQSSLYRLHHVILYQFSPMLNATSLCRQLWYIDKRLVFIAPVPSWRLNPLIMCPEKSVLIKVVYPLISYFFWVYWIISLSRKR